MVGFPLVGAMVRSHPCDTAPRRGRPTVDPTKSRASDGRKYESKASQTKAAARTRARTSGFLSSHSVSSQHISRHGGSRDVCGDTLAKPLSEALANGVHFGDRRGQSRTKAQPYRAYLATLMWSPR